jgi:predicted MPP superfamily phosphohydrolase
VPPLPRIAWYIRSLCIGYVPALSSTSPWINSSGWVILCAAMNGETAKYVYGAAQNVLRSRPHIQHHHEPRAILKKDQDV